MQCPRCQQVNKEGNNFCSACGGSLRQAPAPAPAPAPVRQVLRAPVAPVHQAPVAPGYQAPVAPVHQAPVAPGYQAPVAPVHQAPVAPGYQAPVAPGYQAPVHPAQFPRPQGWAGGQTGGARLTARPVYQLLLVAAAVCLLSLFFQWESGSAYGRAVYTTRGYEYSDGTRSTWTMPQAEVTYFGGSNGLEPVKLMVLAFVAGSAFAYRQRPWPRWARYTLLGVTGFMGLISIGNLAYEPGVGVILFTLGTGLAIWGAIRVLRSPLV